MKFKTGVALIITGPQTSHKVDAAQALVTGSFVELAADEFQRGARMDEILRHNHGALIVDGFPRNADYAKQLLTFGVERAARGGGLIRFDAPRLIFLTENPPTFHPDEQRFEVVHISTLKATP